MSDDNSEIYDCFERYQKSSSKGDVEALLNLGRMYGSGTVVKEDQDTAFEYFSKAAESGDPEAEFELGLCYRYGVGVKEDKTKGFNLIFDASEKGNFDAMGCLGRILLMGDGVEVNEEKGIELLTRAAEMGSVSAMESLALEYQFGVHVERDYDMYLALTESAASFDSAYGKFMLALYYLEECPPDEETVKKGMDLLISASDDGIFPATLKYIDICQKNGNDLEAAERAAMILEQADDEGPLTAAGKVIVGINGRDGYTDDAIELFKKAIDNGSLEACVELGLIYGEKRSPHFDNSKAFECFMKAAEKGYIPAFKYVGACYKLGRGVGKDLAKAETWYFRGDTENDSDCQLELANIIGHGGSRRSSHPLALIMAKKAFENGNEFAACVLGLWYEEWEDVRSIPDSVYWYRKGAELGEPKAIRKMAEHYMSGTYVKENPGKAFELYTRLSESYEDRDIGFAELGRFYEEGIHVKKDVRKARSLYMEAVRYRNSFAAYRLYEMARESGNKDEMVFWLMSAAGSGSVTAMMDLAARFESGDDVPRSYGEALEWYHRAAETGNKYAKENMAQMLLMDEYEEEVTPYFKLLRSIGVEGKGDFSQLCIARRDGTMGVKRNKKQAVRWFNLSKFLFPVDYLRPVVDEKTGELRMRKMKVEDL